MPFFILLLAYACRRSLDGANRLEMDSVWRHGFKWGARAPSGRESQSWLGVLIITLPALVLVGLDFTLRAASLTLLSFAADFLMLLLLMGVPGWKGHLTAYTEAWRRGDMQAAWHHVKDCLSFHDRGAAAEPEALHLSLSRRFMMAVFERYFLIMFWYLVGGIAVAFLVRGVLALRDQWPQAAARPGFASAASLLAWVPVRLLSFTFGLAGDLSGWLKGGRRSMSASVAPEDVLLNGANSALTGYALDPGRFASVHPDQWPAFGARSFAAIRDLLNRSMLVWICVLALLVIAGIIR
ncbi:regulatory signaling modulator protein AmpE [Marinobacter caseinilyticus]|uniref:regulatory signaling modulator protein AmpE n=1 Tax=Marinobacter caseinilyticus TaxID=2692195 RepID=UPI00140D99F6|nr:regulatory signaling modulator protein AmpE [Marinobacter caseinilyticus]